MKLFRKLKNAYNYFIISIYRKAQFKSFGHRSLIIKPLRIGFPKNIVIGDNVIVAPYTWISAAPLSNNKTPSLIIGSGSNIGHYNHIYSTSSITIGANVLTASHVYISDNLHSYENIELPVLKQPLKQLKPITIGDGAWLGENVCVIGACIGKGSVIGANSVVTKDIPDYCVAVGSPARVIKRYNHTTAQWEKVQTDTN